MRGRYRKNPFTWVVCCLCLEVRFGNCAFSEGLGWMLAVVDNVDGG